MQNITLIPSSLYNKEIISFIDDMISYQDAKNFDSLDEIYQDKFTALCIRALDCDTDIVLSNNANRLLVNYLLKHDRDNEIDLLDDIKKSTKDQFSSYFDELIANERGNKNVSY